jgi:hypothetical protein
MSHILEDGIRLSYRRENLRYHNAILIYLSQICEICIHISQYLVIINVESVATGRHDSPSVINGRSHCVHFSCVR